jgi:hypothetical protein
MDDDEGRPRGVEEPEGVCDCDAGWTWRVRGAWVREGCGTMGEVGVRDVVGCGDATTGEVVRSLPADWVEAQQPYWGMVLCQWFALESKQYKKYKKYKTDIFGMNGGCTCNTNHGSCWQCPTSRCKSIDGEERLVST